MVGIRIKKHFGTYKKEAAKLIQSVLIDKGFYATLDQCIELWEMYSEASFASGWVDIGGYTNDEIFERVKHFFEPLEGSNEASKNFYLQE